MSIQNTVPAAEKRGIHGRVFAAGSAANVQVTRSEPVKVIARYFNGGMCKGYTQDFFPNKDRVHICESTYKPAEDQQRVKVHMRDLKAVFFVKDFKGMPSYVENKEFMGNSPMSGRKVEVTFLDEEVMVGTTLGYDSSRPGFFLYPVDPQSNNIRVFAISAAIRRVRYL